MTAQDIQAVFVDVDGTTFRHDIYEVPQSTFDALHRLKKQGIKLCLLSSRTPEETIHLPRNFIELMDARLWSAGAVVIENSKWTIHTIHSDDALTLMEYARQHELVVRYSTGEKGYFDQRTKPEFSAIFDYLYHTQPENKRWENDPCVCAVVFADPTQQDELAQKLKHSRFTKMPNCIEITPQGIDKGSALIAQCQRWGIPVEKTVAFGDGINDITMLKAAGLGIAMGNAHATVRAAADKICGRIEDDGLYRCVKELGLI